MKSFVITILLSFLIQFCYCQDKIEIEASHHLIYMEKIIDLSEGQKENILEIFKNYIIEKNAISREKHPREKDYYDALIELYADTKKMVYSELTDKQLKTFEKFQKHRQETMRQKAGEDIHMFIQNHK